MKIIADTGKALLVQYSLAGKTYNLGNKEDPTDETVTGPFDEVTLQPGESLALGDDDVLVKAAPLGVGDPAPGIPEGA